MTIVIEIDFRWTWGIDNMEFIKGIRLGFIALHFVRARLDFFVNSYQYAMSMVEQQQEALTGWDNNCALTAKREKEEANRTADREKGIFKKPTVKQMKKIAKLIKENK